MYTAAGITGLIVAGVGYHCGAHYRPAICLACLSLLVALAR